VLLLPAPSQTIVNVRVYIAPGFSERERANVVNGISLWERATGGKVGWTLVGSAPEANSLQTVDGVKTLYVVYQRVAPDDLRVKRWEKEHNDETMLGQLSIGYDDNVPASPMEVILIESRLTSPRDEMLIAAHEFGHVLGLDHTTSRGSVLSEKYGLTVQGITSADIGLFCARYGC